MTFHAALVLALGAAAIQAQTLDLSNANCPDGWSVNGDNNGNTAIYCCPGSGVIIDSFQGCAVGSTTVAYDNPNYTSIVSSLASMTDVEATATESSSMEETGSSSSDGSMTTGSMSESSGSAGGVMETSASSTSQAGAPVMTAAPILGAAALALLAL